MKSVSTNFPSGFSTSDKHKKYIFHNLRTHVFFFFHRLPDKNWFLHAGNTLENKKTKVR